MHRSLQSDWRRNSLYTFFGRFLHRGHETSLKFAFQLLKKLVYHFLGHRFHAGIENDPQIEQGARHRCASGLGFEKLPREIQKPHATPLGDGPTATFFDRSLNDDESERLRHHRKHTTRHLEMDASMDPPSNPHRDGDDATRKSVESIEPERIAGMVESSREVPSPKGQAGSGSHHDMPTRPFVTGFERRKGLWAWRGHRHHGVYTLPGPIAFL